MQVFQQKQSAYNNITTNISNPGCPKFPAVGMEPNYSMSSVTDTCYTAFQSYALLTFKGRMLDISNAACTPQWPNVRYI